MSNRPQYGRGRPNRFPAPHRGSFQAPQIRPSLGGGFVSMSSEEYVHLTRQMHGRGRGGYRPNTMQSDKHPPKSKTVWNTDVIGDVDIPEICVFSIGKKCSFEESGCRKLHAKSPLQWQFLCKRKWYNFREFHSKELEVAFQDPENDSVDLSPLDSAKMNDASLKILKLLGSGTLSADFTQMELVTVEGNSPFKIRRLSTFSSASTNNKMATVFEWYFQDEFGKWIKYGQANTKNDSRLIPNINSEDVEVKFVVDKQDNFEFSSSEHKYLLDFSDMTQTNLATQTKRPIRRRPQFKKNVASGSNVKNLALPKNWTQMSDNEEFKTVPLNNFDVEYLEVKVLMKKTLSGCTIKSIKRIQNPYYWAAFEDKKKFIIKQRDLSDPNERLLFHGTHPDNVMAILRENLDKNLCGAHGRMYGHGIYFSSSASYSDQYSTASSGKKLMFVAKVLVGRCCRGDSSTRRPPNVESKSYQYDTTVNDTANPTIFVKYYEHEYYLQYLVEYR